jgi:hypothetical protein
MTIRDDMGMVQVALARIADPTERERTTEAFHRIILEMYDMKARIRSAKETLADIREQLESQMEFWKPDGDKA